MKSAVAFSGLVRLRLEVVLFFRPACRVANMGQCFIQAANLMGFVFICLIWRQYAVGGVGPLRVIAGHPFCDAGTHL